MTELEAQRDLLATQSRQASAAESGGEGVSVYQVSIYLSERMGRVLLPEIHESKARASTACLNLNRVAPYLKAETVKIYDPEDNTQDDKQDEEEE